jgi:hypothetical protein
MEDLAPDQTPPVIEYAHPSSRQPPDRALRFALASLCLSIMMLLLTLALTWVLNQAADNLRQQIAALPSMLATNKIYAARAQANQANRLAALQAAAADDAKRPPPKPCDPSQAQQIVQVAQSQLQAPMSDKQRQTLINQLQKPGQSLVDPAIPLAPLSTTGRRTRVQPGFQLVEADTGGRASGGVIRVQLYRSYKSLADYQGSTLELALDGTLYIQGSASPQTRLAAGQSLTRSLQSNNNMGLPPNYAAQLKSHEFSLRVAIAISACQAAIFALLFAAGFSALWRKPIWTLLHRSYVWTQLLLVVIGTSVCLFSADIGPPADSLIAALFFIIAILATYPVILLLLLPKPSRTAAR